MPEIFRGVWARPVEFLAFGFGAGLLPLVPGTFGTLMAIPFYLLFKGLSWQIYLAVVVITFVIGVWICDVTEKRIGIADYRGIVWDEMVGYWCAMFLAPNGWQWILLGFVLFRLFDIVKPWPINWVNNHVHGGFGIMIDDVLAALPTFGILQLIYWVIVRFSQ